MWERGKDKGKRQIAAFWSLGLLLQQFHTVLLQDVAPGPTQLIYEFQPTDKQHGLHGYYSRNDSRPRDTDNAGNVSNCSTQQLQTLTSDVTLVLRNQYSEIVGKVLDLMPSCSSSMETDLKAFWQSDVLLKPFYHIISALLYSLAGCPREMAEKLLDAEEELDCEINQWALTFLLDVLDGSSRPSEQDNTESDGTSEAEPDTGNPVSCYPNTAHISDDPSEQDKLEAKIEILQKNIMNLAELSNLMKEYSLTTIETEKEPVRKALNELTTSMTKTLSEEQAFIASEMSCNSPQNMELEMTDSAVLPEKNLNISHVRTRRAIIQHPIHLSSTRVSTEKAKNKVDQTNLKSKIRQRRDVRLPSKGVSQKVDNQTLVSKRQYWHDSRNSAKIQSTFIVQMAGCVLLTSDGGGSLSVREKYNNNLFKRQVWTLVNRNTLKNKDTDHSISISSVQCKSSQTDPPPYPSISGPSPLGCASDDGGAFALPTKDCVVTLEEDVLLDSHLQNSTIALLWKLMPLTLHRFVDDLVCPNLKKAESLSNPLLSGNMSSAASSVDSHVDDRKVQLWYLNQVHLFHFYTSAILMDAEEKVKECYTTSASLKNRNNKLPVMHTNSTLGEKNISLPMVSTSGDDLLFEKEDIHKFIYKRNQPQISPIAIDNSSPLFFLKSNGECKLLTSKDNGNLLIREEYNDNLISKQLWLLNNRTYLQNIDSKTSVSVKSIECKSTQLQFPVSTPLEDGPFPQGCALGDGETLGFSSEDCVITLTANPTLGEPQNTAALLWHLVPFSPGEEYLQEVVCPFFIRLDSFPCQLLTDYDRYVISTAAFDLDYPETQLWYWNNNRLINYFSGLALATVPRNPSQNNFDIKLEVPREINDTNFINQLWETNGSVIQSLVRSELYLNVHYDNGPAIEMSSISGESWSFLNALDRENVIDVTSCVQMFFIKVKALPCLLLTAEEGETEAYMKPYNSSRVLNQLWATRGGHLINMAGNLVLGFQGNHMSTQFRAELQSLDDFQDTQKWDIGALITSDWNTACLLHVDDVTNVIEVDCSSDSITSYYEWQLIEFGKGFHSMDMIQCHYVIKSDHPSCEVLTGYPETGVIQLRPMTDKLHHFQLWHWEGPFLVHTASGLYVTTSTNNPRHLELTLSSFNMSKTQQWRSSDNFIHAAFQNAVVTLLEDNGHLSLNKITENRFQRWEFIKTSEDTEQAGFLNCTPRNHSYFFIKSTLTPCLLLTGAPEGGVVELRHYDTNAAQLWYWDLDHLINLKYGLALNFLDSGGAKMSDTSAFERVQRWSLDGHILRLVANESCSLSFPRFNEQSLMLAANGHSKQQRWELIDAENVDNDPEDIVCLYFIQNQLSPCEVLTGYSTNETVNVRPVTDDLVYSQLWYWEGHHLIHTITGSALDLSESDGLNHDRNIILTSLSDVKHNYSLEYHDTQLIFQNKALTVDIDKDGVVKWSPLLPSPTLMEKWKIIKKEDALINQNVLHCEAQKKQITYYIKNDAQPCQLLTAGSKGESPYFQVFDDNVADMQLWYKDGSHIINAGTNLAIHLQQHDDSSGSIVMWDKYAFAMQQRWEQQGNLLKSDLGKCILTTENGKVSCLKESRYNQHNWEFVENKEVSGLEDVVCFYFLRNQHESCEYMTGYSEGNPVVLRPIMEELLENQLWFWNGLRITNVKTGLVLHWEGSQLLHATLNKMAIGNNKTQQWTHQDSQIRPFFNHSLSLDINVDDNGQVEVREKNDMTTQKWIFVEMTRAHKNPNILRCVPLPRDPTLFFLKNQGKPCELLTAMNDLNTVGFQAFNGDILGQQLWFWHDQHLMNYGTGLALQQGPTSVLWPVSAFVKKQRWGQRQDQIICLKQDCYLFALPAGGVATENWQSRNINEKYKFWGKVYYDEKMANFDAVVCSFFVKNNLLPCELLTAFDRGEPVRVRPWDPKLSQLWYQEGPYFVNKDSDLVLHTNVHDNTVRLSKKRTGLDRQQWKMTDTETGYILSERIGLVIDLSASILTLSNKSESKSQQWTLVLQERGLKKTALLNCEPDRTSITPFIIKNEQDPCHLLTQLQIGQVTLHEFNDDLVDRQQWFQETKHILSTNNDLALSAKTYETMPFGPVSLKRKFSYESYQMWEKQDQLILSLLHNKAFVLASDGSELVIQAEKGGYAEQWTWLNLTDIKADRNLVARCSRCYDKKEETAAKVIGFIPVISTIYNLMRSVTYARKGCKDVALESLGGAAMDIALDIDIAVATVATAGLAASSAFAVNTVNKEGIKAGARAFKLGIKEHVKVGLHALKSGFKALIKQGIKNTARNRIKSSFKSVKNTLKSVQHLTITTVKGIKSISIKSFHLSSKVETKLKGVSLQQMFKTQEKTLSKVNVKHISASVGRKIIMKSKTLANILTALGDELVSKAEHKIKQLEEIQAKTWH